MVGLSNKQKVLEKRKHKHTHSHKRKQERNKSIPIKYEYIHYLDFLSQIDYILNFPKLIHLDSIGSLILHTKVWCTKVTSLVFYLSTQEKFKNNTALSSLIFLLLSKYTYTGLRNFSITN